MMLTVVPYLLGSNKLWDSHTKEKTLYSTPKRDNQQQAAGDVDLPTGGTIVGVVIQRPRSLKKKEKEKIICLDFRVLCLAPVLSHRAVARKSRVWSLNANPVGVGS